MNSSGEDILEDQETNDWQDSSDIEQDEIQQENSIIHLEDENAEGEDLFSENFEK